jgi:anti-sigma factor RsiW
VTQAELTCKELTELITDYLEDGLSQADLIKFEQHLAICAGCITYLYQMRATVRGLRSKPPLKIPPAVESALIEAFRHWKNPRH